MAISKLGSDSVLQSGVNQIVLSYACNSGDDRKLLIGTAAESSTSETINSVTYNNGPMTGLIRARLGGFNHVSLYYLDDDDYPSTPGSYNATVQWTGTVWPGMVFILELEGAAQGDPEADSDNYLTSVSELDLDLTTLTNGAWLVGQVSTGQTTTFTLDSGTVDEQESGGSGGAAGAIGRDLIATAGASTLGFNAAASMNRFVGVICSIAPADAAAQIANANIFGQNF